MCCEDAGESHECEWQIVRINKLLTSVCWHTQNVSLLDMKVFPWTFNVSGVDVLDRELKLVIKEALKHSRIKVKTMNSNQIFVSSYFYFEVTRSELSDDRYHDESFCDVIRPGPPTILADWISDPLLIMPSWDVSLNEHGRGTLVVDSFNNIKRVPSISGKGLDQRLRQFWEMVPLPS